MSTADVWKGSPVRRAAAHGVRRARRGFSYGVRRARKISPADKMFSPQHPAQYFALSRGAIACIETSLAAAQKSDVDRILDFGCGHGRVLRALRQRFPLARLTASDVDRHGVDFCARTFGATPVYANADAATVKFQDRFDLIWAGSVFTHVDEEAWLTILGLLSSSLASDGVLVFTAHGPDVEARIRAGTTYVDYSLEEEAMTSVLAGYAARGFGYGDYAGLQGYGISVVGAEAARKLIETAGLRIVNYVATGWGRHQDVYSCVRAERPAASHHPQNR